MGIRHAGRRNIEYILLQNKKIGEIVSIDNVQYTVQTIIDRYIHAFQFAINILRKVPEQANFLVIEMDPNTFNPTSLGRIIEETIYGVLQNLQTFSITNKERTELKICETVEMETLFSAGNIDKCQLDCMILAQKNKAIYLSDDLFFRKLANAIGLKNVNLTWLLRYMGNLVRTQKIIKEIRETNYLTT